MQAFCISTAEAIAESGDLKNVGLSCSISLEFKSPLLCRQAGAGTTTARDWDVLQIK
jgi:hypothetical protein